MSYRQASVRVPKVYNRWARGSRDFVQAEATKTIETLLARGVSWESIKIAEGFSGQEWTITVYWLGYREEAVDDASCQTDRGNASTGA